LGRRCLALRHIGGLLTKRLATAHAACRLSVKTGQHHQDGQDQRPKFHDFSYLL
jgi:hypothetical protein